MIQQLTLTPLKGAAATSPRQRLGGRSGSKPAPYRGKSIKRGRAFALTACPSHAPCPPRAMPWAMSGLALQAAFIQRGQLRYYCQKIRNEPLKAMEWRGQRWSLTKIRNKREEIRNKKATLCSVHNGAPIILSFIARPWDACQGKNLNF